MVSSLIVYTLYTPPPDKSRPYIAYTGNYSCIHFSAQIPPNSLRNNSLQQSGPGRSVSVVRVYTRVFVTRLFTSTYVISRFITRKLGLGGRELSAPRLRGVDGVEDRLQSLQVAGIGCAEDGGRRAFDHSGKPTKDARRSLPNPLRGFHGNSGGDSRRTGLS